MSTEEPFASIVAAWRWPLPLWPLRNSQADNYRLKPALV